MNATITQTRRTPDSACTSNPTLAQLGEPIGATGRRAFGNWDDRVFSAWLAGPVDRLWVALERERSDVRNRTVTSYLRLVQEGIGLGQLGELSSSPRGLLDALARYRLPEWLAALDPAARTQLLADVWNVTEGVAREASWLNQYLLARCSQFVDATKFTAQIAQLLEQVIDAPTKVNWAGPFHVSIFDTRSVDDEFLPGPMQLIAPTLVCVRDRRRDSNFGLLLQCGGQSESVGTLGAAAVFDPSPDQPPLVWERGIVRVGEVRVELQFLDEPMHVACSASGFLVASAANSQRLWIVETQA